MMNRHVASVAVAGVFLVLAAGSGDDKTTSRAHSEPTPTPTPAPEVWDGTALSLLKIEKWCQETADSKLPQGATLPDLMDQDILLGAKPSRSSRMARWRSYYLTSNGKKAFFSCAIGINQAPTITLE